MRSHPDGLLVLIPGILSVALAMGADASVDRRRGTPALPDAPARLAGRVRSAAARLGPGLVTSADDSGRLHILARPKAPLSSPDARDAALVARAFVAAHADLFDLDPAAADRLALVARDRSGPNTLLRFRQEWNAIPVFQSDLRVHVSPAGEVTELQVELANERPDGGAEPLVTAEEAARRGADGIEPVLDAPAVAALRHDPGPRRETELRFGPLQDQVLARLAYFPLGGALRLAWHLDALSTDGTAYHECVVDARDGTLLYRAAITRNDVFGTVFDGPSPQPSATPGIVPPTPNPPLLVGRTRLSFAGDPAASPAGWVGTGNETIGNNVTAREDRAGDNEATLGATAKATVQGSDFRFDFDLELGPGTAGPASYTPAAVTNLFYWNNVLHDYFYDLGFTEAAGNFQESNFGKGGLGNDSVRADAQDGGGTNNANFTTPADGSRPRMQMYLWTSGGRSVDGDFDAEVIAHEYTHGVFGRLVPPGGGGGAQTGALNEGNSDFFALNYFTPATAPLDGDFTAGSYATQNFSRGVRSRPTSTRGTTNDLLYSEFGRVNGLPAEVHRDGEIWVEAMWEVRARLIAKYGFTEGRRRVAQLMIDALKRSAAGPSFVSMRDALIQADNADHGGADQPEIWEAFARRGIGYMAATGSGASLNVAASTDLPSSRGRLRFFESAYCVGETVRVYAGDENNQDATATIVLESGSDRETLGAVRDGVLYRASIETASGAPAPGDGILQIAPGATIRGSYHDADDGAGNAAEATAEATATGAYAVELEAHGLPVQDETPLGLRGVNLTRAYRLPFAFPFFGRLITNLWVSSNGLVTAGSPNGSSVNADLAAFGRLPSIAPLWDALRTNGSAQPGEDVYVSLPTPDTIRFRWVAETTAGAPVTFAATLAESGDILFQYGAGNAAVSPTVGISRGTETFTQIAASHSSMSATRSLENAQAVRYRFPGLAVTTAVFPFFRRTSTQYTGYAVANYDTRFADVVLEARNDRGERIGTATNPVSIPLPPGGQAASVGDQVFGTPPAGDASGWVQARSTTARAALSELFGDNSESTLDGATAVAQPARSLIFTRLEAAASGSGKGVTTSIYLVNPGLVAASATLGWHDDRGAVLGSVVRSIPPRGRLAARAADLFPLLPGALDSGYLRVESDADLAGVEVLDAGDSITMLPAQQPATATRLYSAQFASGRLDSVRYFTDLNLINTAAADRTVSILLVDGSGAPVAGSGVVNPVRRTLGPGGQLRTAGHLLFGLPDPATTDGFRDGSLVITTDGAGVLGDVLFGDATARRFQTGLPLDGAPSSDLIFAQIAEGTAGGARSYFTGVACYNPNSVPVTVTVAAFSRRGLPTGSGTFVLEPGARAARTLSELVAGLDQLGGYLRVSATGGPVSGMAVYGDAALEFLAALPGQRIVP